MRLIKLSTEEFKADEDVHNYFNNRNSEFHSRGMNGVFIFPNGWIAKNSIEPNDTILFSYRGNILYVAKTCSELLPWNGKESEAYPNYLEIDLESLKQVSFSVADLETELRNKTGFTNSIAKSQGWPILPDDSKTVAVVNMLCGQQ